MVSQIQIQSPCSTKKTSKDYAIRNKNIAIVRSLLSSCDVAALKAGRRRVAGTGCGPQR